MSSFDISHVGRERVLSLEFFAPDETRFETNHPLVVIVDFDDL